MMCSDILLFSTPLPLKILCFFLLYAVASSLKTWIREFFAEGIEVDWIAVCSDEDVKKVDDPAVNTFEIGIEVNTQSEIISSFLKKDSNHIKIQIVLTMPLLINHF